MFINETAELNRTMLTALCFAGLPGSPGLDGLNGLGGPKGVPGTPGKDLITHTRHS